jgi:hypothetical protein
VHNGKYIGDRDPRWYGFDVNLVWPGNKDNYPLRLPRGAVAPILRQQEYDNLPVHFDYKSGVFRSWIPEEFKTYQEICDRCFNRLWCCIRRFEQVATDPDTKQQGWLFYIEWVQPYATLSQTTKPGG